MLSLLGKSSSINVRKVLWTCTEIGVEYHHEEYGAGALSLSTDAFLALNPNGMVPVIKDDDFILWESNSICRYLAAKHHRDDLLPTDPQQRAKVEQWMDWQATELNNSWRYAFMALVRHSPAHVDRSAIETSISNWNHHMKILDTQLVKTGAYVTGENFSLADIVLGLSTHRWIMTDMEKPQLPAIAAYYELLSQQPAFLLHGRNGMP